MTFGVHKVVRSKPFLNYPWELTIAVSLCSDERNFFFIYRCTSTFNLCPKYCSGILLKSFCYLYEDVHTNFFVDYWSFCYFQSRFHENCGTTWWSKWTCSSASERQSLVKKMKTASKSIHKPWHNICSKYVPIERTACWTWSVTDRKNSSSSNTISSLLQPARVVPSLKLASW